MLSSADTGACIVKTKKKLKKKLKNKKIIKNKKNP